MFTSTKNRSPSSAWEALAHVFADLRAVYLRISPPAVRFRSGSREVLKQFLQFLGFLAQLFKQTLNVRPIKADASGARTQFVGFEQRVSAMAGETPASTESGFPPAGFPPSASSRLFFSSAFNASQLRNTSDEVSAFTFPKT